MPARCPTLAVIVPYRNRRRNLDTWLDAIRRYDPLRRLNPSIHVVRQANHQLFNRGRLLNMGFELAPHHDYYCFHDVDLVPVSADYSMCEKPAHLSRRVSQFGYRKPYESLFGGVTLFRRDHFMSINGFSNQYFGWGGEDDDLLLRCRCVGLEPEWRDGIFYSLHHDSDYGGAHPNHPRNLARLRRMERSEIDHQTDGLNDLSFNVLATDSLEKRYGMPVTFYHVCFNNHDLDAPDSLPAAHLKPASSARLTPAADGFVANDPDTGEERWLNRQAAAILQLCNGDNTIDRITRALSERFLDNIYEIETDVPRTVAQLAERGLCAYSPPTAGEYVIEPATLGPQTITVTTNDRPDHYRRLLESLAANNIEDYHLVVAVEPGCDETRRLSEEFPHSPKTLLYNPIKLGVRVNPYSVLDYVFANGSLYNLYLEDDLELAIDAVDLANWFRTAPIDPRVVALCLHTVRYDIDTALLDKVFESHQFSALGVALTKQAWDHWLKDEWFNDDHCMSEEGIGWDFSVKALLRSRDLKVVFPVCSRSRHTGKYGTHCRPKHQKGLEGVKINRLRRVGRYEIVADQSSQPGA